jgi:hypothetical protein
MCLSVYFVSESVHLAIVPADCIIVLFLSPRAHASPSYFKADVISTGFYIISFMWNISGIIIPWVTLKLFHLLVCTFSLLFSTLTHTEFINVLYVYET